MPRRGLAALFLLTLLGLAPLTQAGMVEAEGSAMIMNGAVNLAREQAVRNAMRQAMLQTEAHVASTSMISTNVLMIESARIHSSGTIEDVKVLDEWQEGELYHVRIRAHVPAKGAVAAEKNVRYRKRVAVLQFTVENRRHIIDMPDLEVRMPQELVRLMNNSDGFIAVDASRFRLDMRQAQALETANIVRLADELGVQFIVTGAIRDMSPHNYVLYQNRHLETEIGVYDGLSGTRLAAHRFSENVGSGRLFRGAIVPFSSPEFVNTHYGRALDRIMNRKLEMVIADLAPLPFSARIIQVDGTRIFFNAGSVARVKTGDVLMTYRLEPEPMMDRHRKGFLGYRETPLATLAVQQVQPLFAVGELETKAELKVGDIVRFEW